MIEPLDRESIAYLGLGSNLGDRLANMRLAVIALNAHQHIGVDFQHGIAPLYETAPVGVGESHPRYLNSVIRVSTTLAPGALLREILAIETNLGRVRRRPLEPRKIDIDLLLFDDRIIDEPGLTVPHPRLGQRRFVLEPLCEIAPDRVHPSSAVPLTQLLDEVSGAETSVIRVSWPGDPGWWLDRSPVVAGQSTPQTPRPSHLH